MVREHDEHLLEVLKLANKEHGKFAISVGAAFCEDHQKAFEEGLNEDLYRLIDVSPIAEMPDMLFRIFRLTDRGHYRLAQLEGRTQ